MEIVNKEKDNNFLYFSQNTKKIESFASNINSNNNNIIDKFKKEFGLNSFFSKLDEVTKECSKKNWDGYNASTISKKSTLHIKKFFASLPPNCSVPEVSPLPNGRMGIEWSNKDSDLLVSIDKKGMLYWTALINDREKMGRFNFAKNDMDDELLKTIAEF